MIPKIPLQLGTMAKPKNFIFMMDQNNVLHGSASGAYLEIDMDGFGILNPKRDGFVALAMKAEHVPVQLTEEQMQEIMNAYALKDDKIRPGVYFAKMTTIGASDRFSAYYRAYMALMGRPQWYTLEVGQKVYALEPCRGDAEVVKIGKHSANVKFLATGQLVKVSYKDMHARHFNEIGRMAHVLAAVKCAETRQNETLKVFEGVEIPVFGDVDSAIEMLASKPISDEIIITVGSNDVMRITKVTAAQFDITYGDGHIKDIHYVR